jgi:hypothetical protein
MGYDVELDGHARHSMVFETRVSARDSSGRVFHMSRLDVENFEVSARLGLENSGLDQGGTSPREAVEHKIEMRGRHSLSSPSFLSLPPLHFPPRVLPPLF